MKNSLIVVAALVIAQAPAAMAESKAFAVDDFSSLEIDGAMHVVFTAGPSTRVMVETPEGDFSDARIANKDNTLVVSRVSLDARQGWFSWGGRSVSMSADRKTIKVNGKVVPAYTVYVTAPSVEAVSVAQSSLLEAAALNATSLEVNVSSSAEAMLAGQAGEATLSASSSGLLNAAGLKTGALEAMASSSGEVSAAVRGPGAVLVNASSSGEVKLVSGGLATLTVDASSGAAITLAGACLSMTAGASSGASVSASELTCQSVTIDASSGADIEAHASAAATASASSGAEVVISGKPAAQNPSQSSGGDVTFVG